MFEKYPEWLELLRIKGIELFKHYSFPRWMMFLLDTFCALSTFIIACLLPE